MTRLEHMDTGKSEPGVPKKNNSLEWATSDLSHDADRLEEAAEYFQKPPGIVLCVDIFTKRTYSEALSYVDFQINSFHSPRASPLDRPWWHSTVLKQAHKCRKRIVLGFDSTDASDRGAIPVRPSRRLHPSLAAGKERNKGPPGAVCKFETPYAHRW